MAIIRRMDLDADARLTRQEFIAAIKPEEPYSKIMKRSCSKSKISTHLVNRNAFAHTRMPSNISNFKY